MAKEDRDAIKLRRRRFVLAALAAAGVGGTAASLASCKKEPTHPEVCLSEPQPCLSEPMMCLSPPEPPPDAGAGGQTPEHPHHVCLSVEEVPPEACLSVEEPRPQKCLSMVPTPEPEP